MIMEETKLDKQRQQQAYENYVKQKTPVHNLPANMAKAFVTGGAICVIGQAILNFCDKSGLDKDIEMGRCRRAGTHYRIRQLCGRSSDRIQERRTGHGHRLQDLYHCRPGHPVWNIYQLATGAWLLDIEDKRGILI